MAGRGTAMPWIQKKPENQCQITDEFKVDGFSSRLKYKWELLLIIVLWSLEFCKRLYRIRYCCGSNGFGCIRIVTSTRRRKQSRGQPAWYVIKSWLHFLNGQITSNRRSQPKIKLADPLIPGWPLDTTINDNSNTTKLICNKIILIGTNESS